MIDEGTQAPDFELPNQDGELVKLADRRGSWVVLYFYPRADTPGCTAQACGIRDRGADYEAANAAVLGVSPDEPAALRKFADKHGLAFTLLGDADHAVADAYGTWVEKKNYGKTYMGVQRATFLIDPDGVVRHVIPKVSPKTHDEEVLAALGDLGAKTSQLLRLVAIALAAPWVLWALVRALGLDVRHPLVALMSFTHYAALTAPLPLLAALVLRRRVVAGVAAVAALVLAAGVLPRAIDGPRMAPAGDRGATLVVMTANVQYGAGDAREIMRLVREHRVDVLSLQELTPEAVARLDAAGARGVLPGRVIDPRPGAAGSGLMTRRPVRRAGPPDGTGAAQPEGQFAVPGAGEVRVKVTHPPPPISSAAVRAWREELQDLPGPRAGGVPRVLAGDFNGTLDHSELRRVIDSGYHDAADSTGDGLRATWPVGRRRPGLTIDHVLAPEAVSVRRVSVHDVPGSDHRAVIAVLVLPRE